MTRQLRCLGLCVIWDIGRLGNSRVIVARRDRAGSFLKFFQVSGVLYPDVSEGVRRKHSLRRIAVAKDSETPQIHATQSSLGDLEGNDVPVHSAARLHSAG